MYQPSVFCVKLQLHFGGDVHEISVPAYGGAEPTVNDLISVIERNFRVPRVLQNLVFHGQDLHTRPNEPLSRFGIRNGVAVRLVGRMAPPDLINQINAQQYSNISNQPSYYPQQQQQQQSYYPQQQQQPYYPQQQQQPYYPQQQQQPTVYQTTEQNGSYYSEQFHYAPHPSVGTQYDPPPPSTPQNKIQSPPPSTPQNKISSPPTPNQGQASERANGQEQTPSATPKK